MLPNIKSSAMSICVLTKQLLLKLLYVLHVIYLDGDFHWIFIIYAKTGATIKHTYHSQYVVLPWIYFIIILQHTLNWIICIPPNHTFFIQGFTMDIPELPPVHDYGCGRRFLWWDLENEFFIWKQATTSLTRRNQAGRKGMVFL